MLEGEKHSQTANATRWNAKVHIIQSILNINKEKLDNLETVKLSTYESNRLQELCDILQPFQVVTDIIQKEKIVSASMVIPCILWLKRKMKSICAKFQNKQGAVLESSINTRLSSY